MTFQFLCPQGHLLQGEEAHMGMQCQCPQCGVAFIIPTIEQPRGGGTTSAPVQTPEIDLAPLDDQDAPLGFPGKSTAPKDLESLAPSRPFDSGELTGGELDTDDLDHAAASEELLHIPCPNGHELEVPFDMLNQRAICPHCHVEFRLKREKSIEYIFQQEALDRKRAEFWFKMAIVAAGVVGVVLVVMFLAMMVS